MVYICCFVLLSFSSNKFDGFKVEKEDNDRVIHRNVELNIVQLNIIIHIKHISQVFILIKL